MSHPAHIILRGTATSDSLGMVRVRIDYDRANDMDHELACNEESRLRELLDQIYESYHNVYYDQYEEHEGD